ncbi:MAG: DUF3418 domain-containing protein, partial [Akkermansia sp.]|nr:DUF3418 domain-containing protein [Akkermansia sp.]
FVMQRSGKFCNAGQFDFSRLPADLITKIWVCNDAGDELAMGTNVQELRERLETYRLKRFHKKAARTFSSSPMTRWDCGDLPESVDIGTGTGYPALQDDGTHASVRVFPDAAEAALAHRLGVRRLVLCKHGDFINSIRKKIPISGLEAKLALSTIGETPSVNAHDTIYAAMDSTLAPLPRTAEQFHAACLRMRDGLYDAIAGTYSRIWEQLATAHTLLREFCLTAAQNRYTARIAEDLQREWSWLTRPQFLSSTPPERHNDILRYARGFQERLRRIKEQPANRELERIDTICSVVHPDFYTHFNRHPQSAAWLEYGLMLAEFRLSVFAPALALKGRASAKKLEAAAERLG